MILHTNGLGNAAPIVTSGISTAGTVGTAIAVHAGLLTAGSLAIPVIGAAIAGVTLLVGAWLNSIAKHNAEKTATTQIVNQAEPLLKQNVNAYMALQSPTVSEQAQALANFDAVWSQVVQACEANGQYEQAGLNCVNDRSRGGKWDWFSYYRDPIALSSPVPDTLGSLDLGSGSLAGLLLPVALIAAAYVLG